ncbi:MAG: hypothetical protein ACE149_06485 [Armatimonadota bacterium]
MRQRGEQHLTNWLRQENYRPAGPRAPRGRDFIGNQIPAGTRVIDPPALRQINVNFVRIESRCGTPAHQFVFLPRTSFYPGYFHADDGFYGFRHHGHHSFIVINFFYPFYFSDPYWFAFSYPGFYPSVYSMWGWCPGWVYPDRVYYNPYDYVYSPAAYSPRLYLDSDGQQRAINDIRHAWIESDPSLLLSHLTNQVDVRIYFNGQYSYTSSTDDYYAMTVDTMSTTRTAAMDFDNPIWISSNEVFYAGHQVFADPDGAQHDLYISYRLRKLGSDWYVVAFGSSPDPIRSQYKDFRYR